jgi:DNA-binding SARP family transcriptional activator/Tfp pilus assembly protein PilF
MADQTAFHLRLLGPPCVVGPGGRVLAGRAVQRRRLGLLALLALAPDSGLQRDKVMAYLWPERDDRHARSLLKQAVYVVRASLGPDAITATADRVGLNAGRVQVDARDFDDAMARGDHPAALALYRGPFLDGFFLSDAPEFEQWMEGERQRLAGSYRQALEAVAESAEAARDFPRAVEAWKSLISQDPFDSRVAVRMAAAIEAGGNRGGAVQFAMAHAQLIRQELGVEPPAELVALVERVRHAGDEGPHAPGAALPRRSSGIASDDAPALSARRFPTAPSILADTGSEAAGEAATPPSAPSWRGWIHRVATFAVVVGVVGVLVVALVRSRRGVSDQTGRRAIPDQGSRAAVAATGGAPEPPQFLAAHEFYLRGSDPALLRNDSGVQKRLQYFLQAVALDSTYGEAYAALAATYVRLTMADQPDVPARELQARAEAAAARGVALADSVGRTHAVLGLVRMRAGDFVAAEDELRQAIALDPTDALAHDWLGGLYLYTGRPAEGLEQARQALALDPLSSAVIADFAHALLFNHRCEEAHAQLERIASVRPPLLRAAPIAAQCFAAEHDWTRAAEVLQSQKDRDPASLALFGYMLGRAGRRADALRVEAALLDRWRQRHEGAEHLAEVYSGLGDLDKAFTWLDQALVDRTLVVNPWYGEVLEPVFQELREDRRFQRARERLDLPGR